MKPIDKALARRVSKSPGLCRESTGTHPQESQAPVYKVEDQGSQGNSSDICIRFQVSHQCHIHNAQHGNGDVADDVGYGQVQDLLIQSSEILTEDNEISNLFAF